MPDLIAQGTHNRERWRRKLPDDASATVVIGRTGEPSMGTLFWPVPWDHQISREHALLVSQTMEAASSRNRLSHAIRFFIADKSDPSSN